MKRAREINLIGKEVVSIDIGQHTTKIVTGIREKDFIGLTHAISFPTPSDSYERGRIKNMSELKSVIEKILQELNIKTRLALCSVESGEMVTREVMVPSGSNDDILKMINYEIQQYMPVTLSEYMVLPKILKQVNDNGVSKVHALVTAVPNEVVYSFYDLFKFLNLKPVVFDTQSNAIDKLMSSDTGFNNDPNHADMSYAVLEIGYSHSNVSIFKDGKYLFSRLINQGAQSIDQNLVRFLNISIEEAQRYKHSISDLNQHIDDPGKTFDLESEEAMEMKVLSVTRKTVDDWLGSVEKIMQYYITQNVNNRIDHVYLYGGITGMNGFDQYVQNAYSMPAYMINNLTNVSCESFVGGDDLSLYVNALGTMIRR